MSFSVYICPDCSIHNRGEFRLYEQEKTDWLKCLNCSSAWDPEELISYTYDLYRAPTNHWESITKKTLNSDGIVLPPGTTSDQLRIKELEYTVQEMDTNFQTQIRALNDQIFNLKLSINTINNKFKAQEEFKKKFGFELEADTDDIQT